MAGNGFNTAGTSNPDFLQLGRGKLYFASLKANGRPDALRFLGNCPEFNLSVEIENLEHQSSEEGLKVVDKEVIISQKVSVGFQLDHLYLENFASFLSGTTASVTHPAQGSIASFTLILANELVLGRYYQLTDSTGVPVVLIDDPDDVTISDTGGALSSVTDYTLDPVTGLVFFPTTSTATVSDAITFELAAPSAAPANLERVNALTQSSVSGALIFISSNAADGDSKRRIEFHKISLKPEGDLSLIGDDWGQIGFTGAAERNTQLANSPTLTIDALKQAA